LHRFEARVGAAAGQARAGFSVQAPARACRPDAASSVRTTLL